MTTISPTQDAVQAALGDFLELVLPEDVEVIAGVVNRVSEPNVGRFVTMVPVSFRRLRTNVDDEADCKFTGSIAGTTMTVDSVQIGAVAINAPVTGPSVASGTKVVSQQSGPVGGAGTYTVSPTQTVSDGTLSAGQKTLEQGAEVEVQMDFHTADNTASDLAQIVSTTLRDEYGVQAFADQNGGVVPISADDPQYLPWINENQQYEWRWVVRAHLQVNQVAVVPQQYFDGATVTTISVDTVVDSPWPLTLLALKQQAQVQSKANTPHQNPNMPSPPVVTTTIGSGLSVNLELPDISWFTSMGGDFQFFLSVWGWFLCATQAASGGINGSGQNPVTSRIWFRTSAPKISFLVLGQSIPYRFIVDGYYVDKNGTLTATSSGGNFLTLDFGSSAPRDIALEMTRAQALFGIFIAPGDVVAPSSLRPTKCIVLGDSITAGAGTTTTVADGVWPQTVERLGFDIYRASGVGSTGYVEDAGGTLYNLPERIAPDAVTPGADLFIIAMGINDQLASPAQVTANARLCVSTLRAAHPASIVILVGPYDAGAPTPPSSIFTATRDAIFAVADPSQGIFTVDLTGVVYDQNGPPHPSNAGALTLSDFITAAIYDLFGVTA